MRQQNQTIDLARCAVGRCIGRGRAPKAGADHRNRPGSVAVQIADRSAAEAAMEALKGTQLNGRTLDIVPDNSGGRPRPRRR